MEKNEIFNRDALDKLRSPEKLDTMFPITTPVNWVALAALGVLVASILVWSIFGAFTVKADGMGLVMDSSGVKSIASTTPGKVEALYVQKGSIVKKGDLIAKMQQTAGAAETRMAQYGMGLAKNDREAMEKVYQYNAKKEQLGVAEDVYSDYDGVVDDVVAEGGAFLGAGSPICTVRITENRDDLSGILYVPVDKGKRIEPGMTLQLAPNGVDVTESGSLMGVVRDLSQYPVSAESVRQKLGNPQMAAWIHQKADSVLMEVRFDLIKDDSPSGYLWTSSVGEHKPITPGSFVTGSVIIERRPPIEKVFYKLSQWVRSR